MWIVADILEKYVFDLLLPILDASDIREAAEDHESITNAEAAALTAEKTRTITRWRSTATCSTDKIDAGLYVRRTKRLRERNEVIEAQIASMRGHSALDRLGGEVQAQWQWMTLRTARSSFQRSSLRS